MSDHEQAGKWSAGQLAELRRALAARRHRQNRVGTAIAALVIGIVGAGILLRLSPDWWVPAVGIVALAALVFRMTNWRCPACGEGLPLRGSGRACRGCGLPLE